MEMQIYQLQRSQEVDDGSSFSSGGESGYSYGEICGRRCNKR